MNFSSKFLYGKTPRRSVGSRGSAPCDAGLGVYSPKSVIEGQQ